MDKPILSYKDFMYNVGNKRSKAIGMQDIKMISFDKIVQDKHSGDYKVQVRLRKGYHNYL